VIARRRPVTGAVRIWLVRRSPPLELDDGVLADAERIC
jgi:hypothetical protein